MPRSTSVPHPLVLGCLVLSLSTGTALGDDEEIAGLARVLRSAWESFEEFQEVASAHGARREIALTHLKLEHELSSLQRTIQDMETETGSWHPNRVRWNSVQVQFWEELQGYRRNRTEYHHQLRTLDLQWRELNEAARAQAEFKRKKPIPMDREGLLREFLRLEDQEYQTYYTAKLAVGRVAGESKQSAFEVLRQAAEYLRRPYFSSANPQTLEPFLNDFKAFYGSNGKSKGKSKGKPTRPAKKAPLPVAKKAPLPAKKPEKAGVWSVPQKQP